MSKISKWKATQNLLNTCFGTGILAMPYAIGVAEWYSFISVFLAFSMATYSAICLAKITLKSCYMEKVQSASTIDIKISPTAISVESTNFEMTETAEMTAMTSSTSESEVSSDDESVHEEELDENKKGSMESAKSAQDKLPKKSIFAQISYDSLGQYGEMYGVISFVGTLLMLDIIVLIQSFELLQQILSTIIHIEDNLALSEVFLFVYLFIFMLPTCFALNWNQMSWISILSNISVSIIICMIMYVFIRFFIEFNGASIPSDYFEEYDPTLDVNIVRHATEYQGVASLIFYSFLVFTVSIAASAVIPSLTISLQNDKDIYAVIITAYSIVTFVYVLCGICGYIVYGGYTHVMIINNFFNWPGGWLIVIVSITIFVNLWGSYGIYSGLLAEIMDAFVGIEPESKIKRRGLRIFVLFLQCVIAYFSRNFLAFLFAVNGIWSIALGSGLTLIWMLYIGIFWNELSKQSIMIHFILLIICIGIGVYASYGAVTGLL